jgi:RNA polymerase sigma-70 factor (ECF subfamily)
MNELCHRLARDLDGNFPELVGLLRQDIYSGLRRLHPAEAEDLTQETLIRAYRALAGYEPDRIRRLQLRGWIWTIALNLGRNHARDKARRPQPVEYEDHHASTDPEPPDSAAWDRRLRGLSPLQRQAVVLRHVVGLSYPEIAQVMERPEGTVKAEVHRGLRRLKQIMEEEE